MKKLAAMILAMICVMSCSVGCACAGDTGMNNSSGPADNNGTVTDGDGFIGNDGNPGNQGSQNADTTSAATTPDMSGNDSRARDFFDSVL